jgi:hypothetical protein
MYARGEDDEIPVHRMLRESAGSVRKRAQRLSESLGGDLEHAHVHRCAIRDRRGIHARDHDRLVGGTTHGAGADGLRRPDAAGSPAAFCRVEDDQCCSICAP